MYPQLEATDLDIKIFPQYPRRIVVSWEVGKNVIVPLRFNVFRSGGLEGEFKKLNNNPIPDFFYFDDGLKPLSKIFNVDYKLEVIWPTGQTQILGPFSLVSSPRQKHAYLIAKEMDREYSIEYKAYSGVNLRIYKQRQWGERCTECYNPITEEVTDSNCPGCFGTSFVGGFWNPIDILGKIDIYPRGQQIRDPFGFTEDHVSTAHIRAFPTVRKGDIIIERAHNIRWYVNSVSVIEHARFPVKQLAEVRQIERSSVFYELDSND
jgi:hypothetical protein